MRYLWTFLVLVAAAINLAPLLGAVAPERMTALYGVNHLIARCVGEYSAEIQRVILLDVTGIAALAGAGLVHALWLRGTGA